MSCHKGLLTAALSGCCKRRRSQARKTSPMMMLRLPRARKQRNTSPWADSDEASRDRPRPIQGRLTRNMWRPTSPWVPEWRQRR